MFLFFVLPDNKYQPPRLKIPTLYQDYDDDDLYVERTVTRSKSQLQACDISTKSDISTVTRSMSQLHAGDISTKSNIFNVTNTSPDPNFGT